MHVGTLRKQVTIQAETSVTDDAGGYELGWVDITTVWAEIKPLRGTKVLTADHLEGHVTHSVLMRHRGDITIDMRLVYGSRLFNIHAAINIDERNQWTELLVEEGAA